MTVSTAIRPAPDEYLSYFDRYIALVPESEAIPALEHQAEIMFALLRGMDEAQGALRYAPGKWSIKQVLGHLADAERVFAYRALRFGRGDTAPLAGFDENDYAAIGQFDQQSLGDLVDQLDVVRKSTIALLRGFDAEAWTRRGEANGHAVSVRALAFIIAGHGYHHTGILKERYLNAGAVGAPRP